MGGVRRLEGVAGLRATDQAASGWRSPPSWPRLAGLSLSAWVVFALRLPREHVVQDPPAGDQ